jgi:hypothetical protein
MVYSDRRNALFTSPEYAVSTTAEPKPPRRPPLAHVARLSRRRKAKSGTKASPAKKGPKMPQGKQKSDSARDGSKAATILERWKRPGGATSKELMKATGWQPHSVRGFLSGTIRKKMGRDVISTKGEVGSAATPSRPESLAFPFPRAGFSSGGSARFMPAPSYARWQSPQTCARPAILPPPLYRFRYREIPVLDIVTGNHIVPASPATTPCPSALLLEHGAA